MCITAVAEMSAAMAAEMGAAMAAATVASRRVAIHFTLSPVKNMEALMLKIMIFWPKKILSSAYKRFIYNLIKN